VRPVASRFRMPHAVIVAEPGSESIGNVMPCLSANVFRVAVES